MGTPGCKIFTYQPNRQCYRNTASCKSVYHILGTVRMTAHLCPDQAMRNLELLQSPNQTGYMNVNSWQSVHRSIPGRARLKPRIHERFFRPQESVVRRLMKRFAYTRIVFITQLQPAVPATLVTGSVDRRLPCVRVCWCCRDGCNNSQTFVKHCCGFCNSDKRSELIATVQSNLQWHYVTIWRWRWERLPDILTVQSQARQDAASCVYDAVFLSCGRGFIYMHAAGNTARNAGWETGEMARGFGGTDEREWAEYSKYGYATVWYRLEHVLARGTEK